MIWETFRLFEHNNDVKLQLFFPELEESTEMITSAVCMCHFEGKFSPFAKFWRYIRTGLVLEAYARRHFRKVYSSVKCIDPWRTLPHVA